MGVIASASVDSGLSCFVFMARFLRLPVDPEQIRFEAGKVDQSFTAQDIVRAARRIELKARRTKVSARWLECANPSSNGSVNAPLQRWNHGLQRPCCTGAPTYQVAQAHPATHRSRRWRY
jgi:hypothetical protein